MEKAKKIHVDITMDPEVKRMAVRDSHKMELSVSAYIEKLISTQHVKMVVAENAMIQKAIREGQK